MYTGTVKFFNQKAKFGFIIDDKTKKEYYVYVNAVEGVINANDHVQFKLKPAKRGEECIEVKLIS
jgi:cold shock CspA family protein